MRGTAHSAEPDVYPLTGTLRSMEAYIYRMNTRLVALALGGAIMLLVGGSRSAGPAFAAPAASGISTITHARTSHVAPPTRIPAAADPACTPASGPPPTSRLASRRDYPAIQTTLTVVESTVQPKVSGAKAFARLPYRPGAEDCGLNEFLAYWSSDTPATISPDCQPHSSPNSPWGAPLNCTSTPLYKHVLAWVFTWRTDCITLGPYNPGAGTEPGTMPSRPHLACTAITFVDADTGRPSDYLTTGGF